MVLGATEVDIAQRGSHKGSFFVGFKILIFQGALQL